MNALEREVPTREVPVMMFTPGQVAHRERYLLCDMTDKSFRLISKDISGLAFLVEVARGTSSFENLGKPVEVIVSADGDTSRAYLYYESGILIIILS